MGEGFAWDPFVLWGIFAGDMSSAICAIFCVVLIVAQAVKQWQTTKRLPAANLLTTVLLAAFFFAAAADYMASTASVWTPHHHFLACAKILSGVVAMANTVAWMVLVPRIMSGQMNDDALRAHYDAKPSYRKIEGDRDDR